MMDERPGELRIAENAVGVLERLHAAALPGDPGETFVGGIAPAVADGGKAAVDRDRIHVEIEDAAVAAAPGQRRVSGLRIDLRAQPPQVLDRIDDRPEPGDVGAVVTPRRFVGRAIAKEGIWDEDPHLARAIV